MKIAFACPSCAATGSVDAAAAGRSARCKHCGHRFTIPGPDAAEPDVFALEGPAAAADGDGYAVMDPVQDSTFAPVRGDEPASPVPRRPKGSAPRSKTRTGGKRAVRSAWPVRLAWVGGAAAVAIAAVALFAPSGVLIAACAVMTIGSVLILVGFAVGAYGASPRTSSTAFSTWRSRCTPLTTW